MTSCAVCDGEYEPWVMTVTGMRADVEYVTYAGVRYFVHGAVASRGATTWWLAPAALCERGPHGETPA